MEYPEFSLYSFEKIDDRAGGGPARLSLLTNIVFIRTRRSEASVKTVRELDDIMLITSFEKEKQLNCFTGNIP